MSPLGPFIISFVLILTSAKICSGVSLNPKILIIVNPTRALDFNSAKRVHNLLLKCKSNGTSIMLISEDLDEILKLSDRVAVMFEGEIVGMFEKPSRDDVEKIEALMVGLKR